MQGTGKYLVTVSENSLFVIEFNPEIREQSVWTLIRELFKCTDQMSNCIDFST